MLFGSDSLDILGGDKDAKAFLKAASRYSTRFAVKLFFVLIAISFTYIALTSHDKGIWFRDDFIEAAVNSLLISAFSMFGLFAYITRNITVTLPEEIAPKVEFKDKS